MNVPTIRYKLTLQAGKPPHRSHRESCLGITDGQLAVFTDGSACPVYEGKKPVTASYSVVWPENSSLDEVAVIHSPAETPGDVAARAEFFAVVRALEMRDQLSTPVPHIFVFTDCINVLKAASGSKKGRFRQQCPDLAVRIDEQILKAPATFVLVKAHTGNDDYAAMWNNEADSRARRVFRERYQQST